jgi:two-component system response regulator HydG
MAGRLILVEDDADFRGFLRSQLTRRGYDVVVSASAEEALSQVATTFPDLVLTDVALTGMSGIDLCRQVWELGRDVPVIVVTGHGSLNVAVDALRAGAADFITKPVDVDVLCIAIERALAARALRDEVQRLRESATTGTFGAILGQSEAIQRTCATLSRVARTDVSVLLSGESGTGKELAARALHQQSRRADRAFVAVNCAALPEHLLESELFGHVRGAFTDARSDRVGLFARADGGTLFLDEIGELPIGLQPKLLRALQERSVRPVGGDREEKIDVRLVTATNRDLEAAVLSKAFREDLFYRVNVVGVQLPPLRTRGNDALLLAHHFIQKFARATSRPVEGMSARVAACLLAYSWPGNVRELANAMERAVALTAVSEITPEDLPERVRSPGRPIALSGAENPELLPLAEVERRHISFVCRSVGGNKSHAAQILGIDRKTLHRRLEEYQARTPGAEPRLGQVDPKGES